MAEERNPVGTETQSSREENSVRSLWRRARGAETPGAVPDHVRKRFTQVRNHYYFADGAKAFTDGGRRLSTSSENTEVIKSLIEIAQAREWRVVIVAGTERFRKEAWAAAAAAGLDVRGYQATEFERAQLARNLARERARAGATEYAQPEPARSGVAEPAAPKRGEGFVTGRLLSHGVASYRHDPHEGISYFVKIDTGDGERDIWGVDLQRALKESLTKPKIGDEIGVRAVRREAVRIQQAERDANGKVVGSKPLDAHRNRWIVEKREFFEERDQAAQILRNPRADAKEAARRHPELVGTYLKLHAAEIAARQLKDTEDREKFVARVRAVLADEVARGETLGSVRLRERATPAREAPAREDVPVR